MNTPDPTLVAAAQRAAALEEQDLVLPAEAAFMECIRCRGDGMDPWNDYLLPCPSRAGAPH